MRRIHLKSLKVKFVLILPLLNLLIHAASFAGNRGSINSTPQFIKEQGHYYFFENKGQIIDQNYHTNTSVLYQLSLPGMNVSLKSNGFSYDTWQAEDLGEDSTLMTSYFDKHSSVPHKYNYKFHRVDIEFINANISCKLDASGKASDYNMYYTTGTPEEGAKVYQYERVVYKNLYDGIDLEFVAKPGTTKPVEYNFIVHPGADVSQIKMRYTGALENDLVNGNLELKLAHTSLTESIPSSWIKETGKFVEVEYREIARDNKSIVLGFSAYMKVAKSTLIIDPVPNLDWGTYYGAGTGFGIDTDNFGNVYVSGRTTDGNNIATSGAYQSSFSGTVSGFIVKLSSGGIRKWGTYIGGGNNSECNSIDISNTGDIVVGGKSDVDAFIGKFDSLGTCIWLTNYGGQGGEWFNDVKFDHSGNIVGTGGTTSLNGIATNGAHQMNFSGGPNLSNNDAFLVKFNSLGVIQWGTYYGGTEIEQGYSLATDLNNNIYIAGFTRSNSSISSSGAFQSAISGISDGFVAMFNSLGVRQWGTYFGGSFEDRVRGIEVDCSGNIVIAGFTNSLNGIATSNSFQVSNNGYYDVFICKLNPLGNQIWSTYFGGSLNEYAFSIATDIACNIYITGFTSSNGIATPTAHQSAISSTTDAFLAKFDSNGYRTWCTYYGGIGGDWGWAITVDSLDNVYTTGETWSPNNISTQGAHQDSLLGLIAPFISRFSICGSFYLTSQPSSQNISINDDSHFTVSTSDSLATFQWQTDIGFGFQSLTNAGQYSGVNNDTLTVSNITLGNNNQLFRCIVSNGTCSDTSNTAVLSVIPTGLNEVGSSTSYSIYPNPVTDILKLKTTASNINGVYRIIDLTGRVISNGNISSESTQIDMSQFVAGIYLLSINNGKDFFKIIKE
jgi:hypothetical protein